MEPDQWVRLGLGVLLVLVGLWMVVTGAPQVRQTAKGFLGILSDLFTDHPRVTFGILLILIGGAFIGAEVGDFIGIFTGGSGDS